MRHKVKAKEKTREYAAEDKCHHCWIIETADGPKSRGVCQHCGETRDFLNSIPDFTVMKRNTHPLDLPELPEVELDDGSKS